MNKGKMIVIEGNDGAGKTTFIEHLENILRMAGHQVVRTREPGGTEMGQEIRQVLLNPRDEAVDEQTEMLLFMAARVQNSEQNIKPALQAGKIVLVDRWHGSTYSYQVHGQPHRTKLFDQLIQGLNFPVPDREYILNVSWDVSCERQDKRGRAQDRIEQKGRRFFEQVNAGLATYLKVYARTQGVMIDADVAFEQVIRQVEQDPFWQDLVMPKIGKAPIYVESPAL